MQAETLNIQKFDVKTASEKQWGDLISLLQAAFTEREPDDPIPAKEVMQRDLEVQMQSERNTLNIWIVYDDSGDKAIANCYSYYMTPKADDYESKKHLASFSIFVDANHRRQGIGTQLLEMMARELQQENKTLMESWVSTRAGDAFMKTIGASVAIQMKGNRLYFSEIDWAMLEQWVQEGREKNPDTQLIITDALPEDDQLQPFADLVGHIFGQMPKEDASGFPENISVEWVQDHFDEMNKRNFIMFTGFTIEPDGMMSAMTDVEYQPEISHLLEQGLTGVHLDARGRGLGKWLKAVMLLESRKRFPKVQFIDTANANVNAAMLHINEKLGFKFHNQHTTYKLHVADILKDS